MIVGLSGAAGAGKDTAAAALIDYRGFEKVSFAEMLKACLSAIFDWNLSQWDDLMWKETPNTACYGKTPRELAQTLGTDWGRNMVNENIWVDATLRMLDTGNFVFTDVRFPNEARAIRQRGGLLIHVVCDDGEPRTDQAGHESEKWVPWLEQYADGGITAKKGDTEWLQEAILNVVENYAYNIVPRHEPTDETLEALAELEAKLKTN